MPANVNPSICVRVRLSNTLTINRIKTVKGLCAAVVSSAVEFFWTLPKSTIVRDVLQQLKFGALCFE